MPVATSVAAADAADATFADAREVAVAIELTDRMPSEPRADGFSPEPQRPEMPETPETEAVAPEAGAAVLPPSQDPPPPGSNAAQRWW